MQSLLFAPQARKFLARWTYYTSIVFRDLTLRSAPSFGAFHLLRLLFDEYILYLVEQVAAQGVAVLHTVPAASASAAPLSVLADLSAPPNVEYA